MKRNCFLLWFAIAIFVTSSLCADTNEVDTNESDAHFPAYESSPSMGFNWIFQGYTFNRIEEYYDEYYMGRYKHWEKYLSSKQREFAGKFGLTNILFRPNLRNYEKSKISLSKNVWNNRLLFRYLAPVGDVRDFDLLVALKPYQYMTFIMKGQMNGERRVALVINHPFGPGKSDRETRRIKRLLGRAKKFAE